MKGVDIKDYRNKNKIRQEDFAKTIGVSRQTLSHYENGGDIPSLNVKLIDIIINENIDVLNEPKEEYKPKTIEDIIVDKLFEKLEPRFNDIKIAIEDLNLLKITKEVHGKG